MKTDSVSWVSWWAGYLTASLRQDLYVLRHVSRARVRACARVMGLKG